ncbi:MAG: SPFH domain-containing protein [Kiritimatiellae bacterium]|nr:SPFH domain-containing protein [Kiritimatiellia bacterium]
MKRLSVVLIPVLAVIGAVVFFLWTFCRIPVKAGYMAIVTAKIGQPLPPGQILAEPGQKGVQSTPLPEGRHFLNPVTHEWRIVPAINIPVGKVGVVTSKVGAELPSGEIIAADSGSKGIWKDVLGPGTYRLNPEGYEVTQLDVINIPIGYVGVVTSQTGEPVLPGQFAGVGQKGVMKDVLQPGLFYVNNLAYQVDVLEIGMNQVSILGRSGSVVMTKNQIFSASTALDSLQQNTIQAQQEKRNKYLEQNESRGFISQQTLTDDISSMVQSSRQKLKEFGKSREDLPAGAAQPRSGGDRIDTTPAPESVAFGLKRFVEFPSRDGFQILIDMTVEFELLPENISKIYMLYGDLPAVVDKIILPQILSISRIKGSSYGARDFIDGEGRQQFQMDLTKELTTVMKEKHIVIHNAIIRHVEVPKEILDPIQQASVATEQDLTNQALQKTARKQAELNTQTAMISQLKKQVEQETEKEVATIVAKTKKEVAAIAAAAELEVAQINLEKAAVQAGITELSGEAKVQADFVVANETALGRKMLAAVFTDPATLAELKFVEELNPRLGIRIIHAGEGTLWTDLKNLAPTLPVK